MNTLNHRTLTQDDIADLRLIERIEFSAGHGVIESGDRIFHIHYTDLLDVVQAVETVMLKLTGKVLNRKFVPKLTDRKALSITTLEAGAEDLYDGTQGECPERNAAHYMLIVMADGTRWDQWFNRLDELIKCLYNVVRESQDDATEAKRKLH
jgi:hypothetical protein